MWGSVSPWGTSWRGVLFALMVSVWFRVPSLSSFLCRLVLINSPLSPAIPLVAAAAAASADPVFHNQVPGTLRGLLGVSHSVNAHKLNVYQAPHSSVRSERR
jgi:hypothetical protein